MGDQGRLLSLMMLLSIVVVVVFVDVLSTLECKLPADDLDPVYVYVPHIVGFDLLNLMRVVVAVLVAQVVVFPL